MRQAQFEEQNDSLFVLYVNITEVKCSFITVLLGDVANWT